MGVFEWWLRQNLRATTWIVHHIRRCGVLCQQSDAGAHAALIVVCARATVDVVAGDGGILHAMVRSVRKRKEMAALGHSDTGGREWPGPAGENRGKPGTDVANNRGHQRLLVGPVHEHRADRVFRRSQTQHGQASQEF